MPVLLFAAFLTKTSEQFSRINTVFWFVATPTALAAFRAVARLVLSQLRRHGRYTRSVALAGCTESANALVEYMRADPSAGMLVAGSTTTAPPHGARRATCVSSAATSISW